MLASQFLTADLLDIIFDGRNKKYGAYNLRKTYNNRLVIALTATVGLVVILYLLYSLAGSANGPVPTPFISGPVVLISDPVSKDPVMPPPPPAPAPPAKIKTIKSVVITVVPDDMVTPDDIPPLQEDITNARIARFTQEGAESENIQPVLQGEDGKGIIGPVAPKSGSGLDNNGFEPVEIESEYPGGQKAWMRFLNRMLGNSYPPEAAERNIQGTVVIQFIVDAAGIVSDVKAISGPEELWEAAVNTIRKSGKWKPALQNGRNVKSYKRQPITFLLHSE